MRGPDYTVVLSEKAQAFFDSSRVDNRIKRIIREKLGVLTENPYLGKPLAGEYRGYRRLAVSYYRVIYRIDGDRLVVVVVQIGLRRDVYDA